MNSQNTKQAANSQAPASKTMPSPQPKTRYPGTSYGRSSGYARSSSYQRDFSGFNYL